MMNICLIRHSMTAGNKKKRYIGRTDEALSEEGIALLVGRTVPEAERIYVSPMKRCIQTAEILYPGREYIWVEMLRECDFGIFENKNYEELSDCEEYTQWIKSNGTLPFPGGESREEFQKRSLRGFRQAIDDCRQKKIQTAAFIVHGGTIMSIMEAYAVPKGSYYDFQIGNGEGYELIITDDNSGDSRIFAGSDYGRSQMHISSGTAHRASDHRGGKNYKKLFSGN